LTMTKNHLLNLRNVPLRRMRCQSSQHGPGHQVQIQGCRKAPSQSYLIIHNAHKSNRELTEKQELDEEKVQSISSALGPQLIESMKNNGHLPTSGSSFGSLIDSSYSACCFKMRNTFSRPGYSQLLPQGPYLKFLVRWYYKQN